MNPLVNRLREREREIPKPIQSLSIQEIVANSYAHGEETRQRLALAHYHSTEIHKIEKTNKQKNKKKIEKVQLSTRIRTKIL